MTGKEIYTAPLDRVIQKSLRVRDALGHLIEFAHANHKSDGTLTGNEFKSLIYDLQQVDEDLYLALLRSGFVLLGIHGKEYRDDESRLPFHRLRNEHFAR